MRRLRLCDDAHVEPESTRTGFPRTGQGVYYVTAATYQGATRSDRKTTGVPLSGRDPAGLPGCLQTPMAH